MLCVLTPPASSWAQGWFCRPDFRSYQVCSSRKFGERVSRCCFPEQPGDLYIEREIEAETQAEGEAGSMQGACRGTGCPVSRITPWPAGGAKPLSHPGVPVSWLFLPRTCLLNPSPSPMECVVFLCLKKVTKINLKASCFCNMNLKK